MHALVHTTPSPMRAPDKQSYEKHDSSLQHLKVFLFDRAYNCFPFGALKCPLGDTLSFVCLLVGMTSVTSSLADSLL